MANRLPGRLPGRFESMSILEFLKWQEEQKEAALERVRAMKETDPEFYWSVVRLRADQGLKT